MTAQQLNMKAQLLDTAAKMAAAVMPPVVAPIDPAAIPAAQQAANIELTNQVQVFYCWLEGVLATGSEAAWPTLPMPVEGPGGPLGGGKPGAPPQQITVPQLANAVIALNGADLTAFVGAIGGAGSKAATIAGSLLPILQQLVSGAAGGATPVQK